MKLRLSRLSGPDYPRLPGGSTVSPGGKEEKYGIGFEVQRQTDNGLRGAASRGAPVPLTLGSNGSAKGASQNDSMKTGWRGGANGMMTWVAAAILCVLAGHALAQRSGVKDRETVVAPSTSQLTGPFLSTSSNPTTSSALFVPVILTASGQNNSFFTSELTLTNRGGQEAALHYTYTAHRGGGSGTASETLAPGRQKIVPDAIDYLRTLGIPIPSAGNRVGTLRVGVSGPSEVGVTVRTTTLVADGQAGLAYPGIAAAAGFEEAVYLCGLRQNRQDRSNVAIQNMGTAAEGNVTLRATVYSGDLGRADVLPDVTLEPGGFRQFNGILATAGFTQGYVKVERVSGKAPFYAYGVINDQSNSDGSFIFPVTASSLVGVQGQTLPVIIENTNFSSELIVTNFSSSTRVIDFRFVAEAIESADRTARFSLTLAPGAQRIIPEIVDELRRQEVAGVGPSGRTLAGALFATERSENLGGVVIGARTGSPGGGGQYSVFYNAVPDGAAFSDTAWIEALQQNRDNRSNLALVNTGEVDDSPSVLQLDIYDGETGQLVNTVTGLRVAARGWRQINGILDRYAPGTTQGYVRISKIAGNNPFLAYGVINDGGAPGQRSGDGAYLLPAREGIIDAGTEPMTDREVLEVLYNTTDGPNWRNAEYWLTDAPLGNWYGVSTDASGRVVGLDLSGRWDIEAREWIPHGLSGPIPAELGYLTKLRNLNLANNQLGGRIPLQLTALAELEDLHLSDNALTGAIPPELSKLTQLVRVSLGSNSLDTINVLTGPIPPELARLANLEYLNLHYADLTGQIPAEFGNLLRLHTLKLGGNRLEGKIPAELGKLERLQRLHLGDNQLSGAIPSELGNLGTLQELSLDRNSLSGTVPPSLGNLSELYWLLLNGNVLTGPLPQRFAELAAMNVFIFDDNKELCAPGTTRFADWLKGLDHYEGTFCNEADAAVLEALFESTGGQHWTNADGWLGGPALAEWYGVGTDSLGFLTVLDLSRNQLVGRLPGNLGNLARLTELHLDGNPALTGPLPQSLALAGLPLKALQYADTQLCTPAHPAFRQWLQEIPSHRGTGRECASVSDREVLAVLYKEMNGPNWTNNAGWLTDAPLSAWHGVEVNAEGRIVALRLGRNNLSGEIPTELGYLGNLQQLDLSANGLSGEIPTELGYLGNLQRLDLSGNQLSGDIPAQIGYLFNLEHLDFGANLLTSLIPPELGNLANLEFISFNGNQMAGPIPPELGNLSKLVRLTVFGCAGLRGTIPPELGNMTSLRHLSLFGSGLAGPIPPELALLVNLQTLSIFHSNLTGRIPAELGTLANLMELNLEGNTLSGAVPAELGDLANLVELNLKGNTLSGTVPVELGRLSKLRVLRLSENDLRGVLPPELGALANLQELSFAENALSGAIPREFGNLTNLEELRLAHNNLIGSIPSEFSGLAGLRRLYVSGNHAMEGQLPASLAELSALEALQAGGTEICAPPELLTWLESIPSRRVALCNAEPVEAYLTQAVQSPKFPVPLVAGEEALLRVFVTAARTNDARIPPVRASFHLGGTLAHVTDIPSQPGPIPTEFDERSLARSANAVIPAHLIRPGLEMVVEVDPDGTLDPGLGVARRIPKTGRAAVDVREMPVLDLTLIPLIWTHRPDSSVVTTVAAMSANPESHEMLKDTRALLPVGDLNVTAHEPVRTSAGSWSRYGAFYPWSAWHGIAQAIRVMEGGTGHYMSVISDSAGGIAEQGGRTAFSGLNPGTIAHELGHNMSLKHAPCGGTPDVDHAYPHSDGTIGDWGYDFRDGGRLVPPQSYDLMSYCGPTWVGSYSFDKALRFRLGDEGTSGALLTGPVRSLLLWGGVTAEGQPYLEPAFVVDAPPALPASTGEYTVTGQTALGDELFSLSFAMPEVSHGDGSSSFAFALPVDPSWAGALARLVLAGPGGTMTLDGETARPMVILRNPSSGQVRGFLRDLPEADAPAVSSEPELEVLFSRGVPNPEAWRR